MDKKDIVIIVLFLLILLTTIKNTKNNYNTNDNIKIDTLFIIKEKDSIIYDLVKQDSIIYLIKKEMKYEIEQSINSTDSIAIEHFKELVSE